MGLDAEEFVHPERISSYLFCAICTQVLENPVQTPTEHLFCEDELLEWMSRSSLCPATNTPLAPDSIRRPSRIILNMLAELQRYCPNRGEGCTWVGDNEHCSSHTQSCSFRPRLQLAADLDAAQAKISRLREKLSKAEKKIEILTAANADLAHVNAINERKLRVYSAFLEAKDDQPLVSERPGVRVRVRGEGEARPGYADVGRDADQLEMSASISASEGVGGLTLEEREGQEAASIIKKITRLRTLQGSLDDAATEQTSKISAAGYSSSSDRGRK